MEEKTFKELCEVNKVDELYEFAINKFDIKTYNNKLTENLKNKQVVIFGSGVTGKKLLKSLIKKEIKVEFFCDNDNSKWGKCVDGLYVLPPEFIKNKIEETVVLIAVSNPYPIAKQLEEMKAVHLFTDIDGSIGNSSAPCLFINSDKIFKVNDMFIDEESRKVFLNVLKSRMFPNNIFELGGSIFLHSVTSGSQYFDKEYFKYENEEVYVDCGSFDGDSIVEFYKNMYELNIEKFKAYSFEPDKKNYTKVLKTVEKYQLEDVKVYNFGVGNEEANTIDFFNCRKNEIHEDEVKICRLDDTLKDVNVTFIKMDVEGYELEALKGASCLIKSTKPKLSICVYHNNEDLFKIPLYIKSLVPEYKIFLRHHSYNSICETVCYAYI